jgi:hypothetical protein
MAWSDERERVAVLEIRFFGLSSKKARADFAASFFDDEFPNYNSVSEYLQFW